MTSTEAREKADAYAKFIAKTGIRVSATVAEIERQAFDFAWNAREDLITHHRGNESEKAVVTTVEELVALPVGSVVINELKSTGLAVMQKSVHDSSWYLAGVRMPFHRPLLPATVLFVPPTTDKEKR